MSHEFKRGWALVKFNWFVLKMTRREKDRTILYGDHKYHIVSRRRHERGPKEKTRRIINVTLGGKTRDDYRTKVSDDFDQNYSHLSGTERAQKIQELYKKHVYDQLLTDISKRLNINPKAFTHKTLSYIQKANKSIKYGNGGNPALTKMTWDWSGVADPHILIATHRNSFGLFWCEILEYNWWEWLVQTWHNLWGVGFWPLVFFLILWIAS